MERFKDYLQYLAYTFFFTVILVLVLLQWGRTMWFILLIFVTGCMAKLRSKEQAIAYVLWWISFVVFYLYAHRHYADYVFSISGQVILATQDPDTYKARVTSYTLASLAVFHPVSYRLGGRIVSFWNKFMAMRRARAPVQNIAAPGLRKPPSYDTGIKKNPTEG